MKVKSFFVLLLACGLQVCGYAGGSPADDLKLEYVKHVTKRMNPYEWDDQSLWSNRWSVAAVFFDLNRDGCLDALVATPDQRLGRSFDWLPMQKTDDGGVFIQYYDRSYLSVGCATFLMYKATLSGGLSLLVGKDCFVEKYEEGKRVWLKYPYDLIFRTDAAGRHNPQLDPFMVDKVVDNPDFICLERVEPSWYLGYDLKLAPPNKERTISDRENLPNGGLAAPADFKSFARRYRDEVKRRLNLTRPVTVYAVFLDADLDGDADCYVSSDAEAVGNGRYRWTLHLNDANVFRKAKERVWRNRKTIHDVAMLEPEDVAGKDSFYRVVRTYGSPQILVMEYDGKRLHTHAYTHLLSEEDRTRRPSDDPELKRNGKFCMEDWEDEMRGKYGFMPPKDFRDQVSWLFFHHLERLPCEVLPEE